MESWLLRSSFYEGFYIFITMIKLFSSSITTIKDADIDYFSNLISQQRRERMQGLRRIADRKRSLLAELLIRKIIISEKSIKNEDIIFNFNTFGKPFIPNLQDFHFNLSHSGDWVICAISQKEIGVDIERIRPVDMEIAKYCFTEEEYSELLNLKQDQRPEYFFRTWTCKESYLKAIGVGFMEKGLKTKISKDNLYFRTLNFHPGYCLSVCGYENEFEPDINAVDMTRRIFNS